MLASVFKNNYIDLFICNYEYIKNRLISYGDIKTRFGFPNDLIIL